MKKKLFALLLAAAMVLSLVACGGGDDTTTEDTGDTGSETTESTLTLGYDFATDTEHFGPVYDEWSDMTEDELYEKAKAEGGTIEVYATTSKMLNMVEAFMEDYPGLDLDVMDLDSDEVLSKAEMEYSSGNVTADVLQTKDVNGAVFYEHYQTGIFTPYYPSDICSHIDEDLLKYSLPLYSSQSFWYYNTAAFPDGQPIDSWWNIIEKNEDGSQKYRLFCKEIGTETAYLSLFASFIVNADQMEQAYEDIYGEPLEYTYDASDFAFEVPENNAGVEYMWRFSQMKMTFINDGDELALAVHNSTADDPALALASAGKITNRDESGYDIAWCINLTPYTALLNCESLFVASGCDNPAGARLFIRYVMGGADGTSDGFAPFMKEGNWPVRDDMTNDKNPAQLDELGAIENDFGAIYEIFADCQDMWTYWLNQNPNM